MVSFNGKSFEYTGENTKFIAFPIGGLGAGMFCLEGSSMLSHFSLRHRPSLHNEPGVFAAITVKLPGGNVSKILEGPVQGHKIFGGVSKDLQGFGTGSYGKNYGLPRFTENTFNASFPFCEVS